MESEQLSIRFYNTVRGVEFAMSFSDMGEIQRARAILMAMGLIEREDVDMERPAGDVLVLIDDEKFAAFSRDVGER